MITFIGKKYITVITMQMSKNACTYESLLLFSYFFKPIQILKRIQLVEKLTDSIRLIDSCLSTTFFYSLTFVSHRGITSNLSILYHMSKVNSCQITLESLRITLNLNLNLFRLNDSKWYRFIDLFWYSYFLESRMKNLN